MCFTPDSYSAMILYEFPAFFTCTCDVWKLVRGVEGYACVSCVIILFIVVRLPASDPSLNLVHSFSLSKLGKNL